MSNFKNKIEIDGTVIGFDEPCYIIAEIGINHNGDLKIAKQLIDAAVSANCDAVKFQKRTIDKVYSQEILNSPRESPWGKTQRDQKIGLEFESKEYDEIDEYCKEKGIEWYASSWDVDSQFFLKNYDLNYNKDNIDTVLINSNFTCNYYIDRDKLSQLLKYKSIFSTCSTISRFKISF